MAIIKVDPKFVASLLFPDAFVTIGNCKARVDERGHMMLHFTIIGEGLPVGSEEVTAIIHIERRRVEFKRVEVK